MPFLHSASSDKSLRFLGLSRRGRRSIFVHAASRRPGPRNRDPVLVYSGDPPRPGFRLIRKAEFCVNCRQMANEISEARLDLSSGLPEAIGREPFSIRDDSPECSLSSLERLRHVLTLGRSAGSLVLALEITSVPLVAGAQLRDFLVNHFLGAQVVRLT